MKCPYCGCEDSKVIDSRPTDEGERIRRRRECETVPLIVVKKDGTRESFDRVKLFNGLLRACEKRPVPVEVIEKAVTDIESQLQNSLEKEITSGKIGELAMEKLKDIDEVAYVRFASVYRQFKDVSTFVDEVTKLLNEK